MQVLAKRQPWAAEQRDLILKQAAEYPAAYEQEFGLTTPEIPPEGGQWLHYYACPQTGTKLVFHPPADHVCPDDGKVFQGYPYDQVVYMLRADALGRAALSSGLAYRLAGDRVAAKHAAEILLGYADRYATYPLHDNNGKQSDFGARVYSQTLDESIWLIDITWAYDLVRGAGVMNAEERQHVENDLLRASAAVVGRANGPTDNINSWINAAVAAVGFELNDHALIQQAIDGPRGFRFQMKAFVVDGFWDEGAWGYQFYAMRALTRTAQMAKQAGIDLWKQEPALVALYGSPLGVSFPDGELPAFNDTTQNSVYAYSNLYEVAFSATGDPVFAAVAAKGERKSREALLFGAETLPTAKLPAAKSQVFPDAGYATLRAPGITDVMKFGPHGGGHGHFDKLNQILFADGAIQGVDPGTQLYGVPTHKTWDKQTVAHNTLVVDGRSQRQATGKLLQWQSTPQFTVAVADAGAAYKQAKLTRALLMTPEYLLDMEDARAQDGAVHTFDSVVHNFGTERLSVPTAPGNAPGTQDGYELLTQNLEAHPSGPFTATFTREDGTSLRVLVPALPALQAVYTGMAPGPDLRKPQPYLLMRQQGSAARFAALYAPSSTGAAIDTVVVNGDTITVHSPTWTDTIRWSDRVTYERKAR
ncbi:heparinase II/III domain-containing protein [Terriglobus aquaticus]|uniref:Heparinase II/III family protein n=1 Tax=Terriglobus aquaticus TaxID=940139 RepID=A0ABW9KM87_9BACT|nr:heparinase II/III family protein [Terriglobus aquaticus]